MDYQIGDWVKICEVPPEDKEEEPSWTSPWMDDYCGKVYRVVRMHEYIANCVGVHGENKYKKDEYNQVNFWFAENWVKLAAPPTEAFDFGII